LLFTRGSTVKTSGQISRVCRYLGTYLVPLCASFAWRLGLAERPAWLRRGRNGFDVECRDVRGEMGEQNGEKVSPLSVMRQPSTV